MLTNLLTTLNDVLATHKKIAPLMRGVDRILSRPTIWQRDITPFFEEYEFLLSRLSELDADLEGIYLAEDNRYGEAASIAREATKDPPRKARVEYAISDLDFLPDPKINKEEIVYSGTTISEWVKEVRKWNARAIATVNDQKRV
jgi:hypothetical protein